MTLPNVAHTILATRVVGCPERDKPVNLRKFTSGLGVLSRNERD